MLLEALAPRMISVARGVLGPSDPDVEDAAQEALIAVLRALPAFRGECSVAHYAARIGVRCCMTMRRRGRRERAVVEESSADAGVVGAPVEPVVADRRRAEIRDLLATLPEAQAETLALRVVLGLSMHEVAVATGAPLNTVRSRLRLAKEALRKKIEADPVLAEALEVGS
jgi:RNA polymerase sigma-70 factor (ECF subfamily)